jgi:RNA-directed DNA polymerase
MSPLEWIFHEAAFREGRRSSEVIRSRSFLQQSPFTQVDDAVFKALWQWSKRRHPTKRWQWVKQKYFPQANGRTWSFRGEVDGKRHYLFKMRSVPIKRHIKIEADANPLTRNGNFTLSDGCSIKSKKPYTGKGAGGSFGVSKKGNAQSVSKSSTWIPTWTYTILSGVLWVARTR